MKFIHTADWHLGKLFYGEYLTEEQEWILKNRFLPLIDEENPDVILLAGDVYDRSVRRRKRWSFLMKWFLKSQESGKSLLS